jgi:DNA polymerase III subunit delta
MPSVPVKADDLFTAWAKGLFKPVYLFAGAEDFLIEEATRRLISHRLPGSTAETNLDHLDGETHGADEILQVCQTMPFAADFRFVEVRNVGRLSAEDQKLLAAGIAGLPQTTQLLMTWGKDWRRDDANRPLVEAALQAGSVVIFWPMFPDQAQRWLVARAKHYQKTLDPQAATWLIQEAGESLRRLDQELAKASIYVGGRPQVTQEDLEESFGYQKALSPYEWVTALRQKKSAASLATLEKLLEDDEEPLKLIAIATGSLRDWIEMKEKGSPTVGFRRPGGRRDDGWILQELEKRSVEELVEGLSYCVEAHQTIKTGKETPAMALTLLTLRLCGL